MSFFGTQLIDKGLIQKSDLVKALVSQSNQLPSPIQIVYEDGLLTAEQIIEAISDRDRGESFAATCKSLSYWNDEIDQKVKSIQKRERSPIGQILVDQFGVDLSTLSDELAHTNAPTPNQNIPAPTDPNLSYDFTFPQVSGETKRQYIDFFSAEVKESLEKGFHKFTEGTADAETLANLEEIVQQLTAAASFARMEVSFTICEKLACLVEKISHQGLGCFQDLASLQQTCLKTLDVMWELHRFIDVSGSEQEFWVNDISRSNFSNVISRLNEYVA
ncbi:hypothetical protein [Pseudobacteriovorax antillogorgiicola]|uniref:Uncharacterized protein n=1 Tax=Pseudobacteriovorax antillogorgiicola TaxID=1513793 RepID=A0A1Y6BV17_9BACT|nr:hypothetical protein [Pseudobacteriovorax antillogorgiicola]TCS52371.1 hypothetical protein EDD56_109116 [Pseudobacteriovorax antillogorgiicola]SMF29358.1 hypothetical protein SAMN06296036_10997 [Pseudobacteriovorax antillogorgiicola]